MYWNHRVMKKQDEYGIVEVYYDEDGSIEIWTSVFVAPYGEDVEELRENIEQMLNCLNKPILDEAELNSAIEKSSFTA